jgi:hypothetical protein
VRWSADVADAPSAFANSVVMSGRQSLRLMQTRHHHFREIHGMVVWSVAKALLRPCQVLGSRLACGIVLIPGAGSAVVPLTPPLALRATGRASHTTALGLIDVPALSVSWQGAAAPCQVAW